MTTRRAWLKTTALASCTILLPRRIFAAQSLEDSLAALEAGSGGRLGVAFLDSATGRITGHRLNERFPMCSTFKTLAVAAVLTRVDAGQEHLDRRIPIAQSDILEYAPVTKTHVGPSGMTVRELCAAAITLSDNTAANLLLNTLGGPAAITSFAGTLVDPMTRLDRNEPTLNEAIPYDPRDTTTPQAMARDLEHLLIGTALSPDSRTLLKNWMLDCKTGLKKIRAGAPSNFLVADKTGAGERNTSNDIAVLYPPSGAPKILTIYLTDSRLADSDAQAAVIANATKACIASLRPSSPYAL